MPPQRPKRNQGKSKPGSRSCNKRQSEVDCSSSSGSSNGKRQKKGRNGQSEVHNGSNINPAAGRKREDEEDVEKGGNGDETSDDSDDDASHNNKVAETLDKQVRKLYGKPRRRGWNWLELVGCMCGCCCRQRQVFRFWAKSCLFYLPEYLLMCFLPGDWSTPSRW